MGYSKKHFNSYSDFMDVYEELIAEEDVLVGDTFLNYDSDKNITSFEVCDDNMWSGDISIIGNQVEKIKEIVDNQ